MPSATTVPFARRIGTASLIVLFLLIAMAVLTSPSARAQEATEKTALASLSKGTVVRFSGTEGISTLFSYDVEIETADPALNFSLVIGRRLSVAPIQGWSVNGMIERIEQLDAPVDKPRYRVRLVPTLARLKFRTDTRTFTQMTARDITTAVLTAAGLMPDEIEFRLTRSPVLRERVTQQQESDFAFLLRILREDGIHFHFEPLPGNHKVVFGDTNGAFPTLTRMAFSTTASPSVFSFTTGQQLSAAANPAEGQLCAGKASYPRLMSGHRVLLGGHPRRDLNREYVLTQLEHRVTARGGYEATFQCLPASFVFQTPAE